MQVPSQLIKCLHRQAYGFSCLTLCGKLALPSAPQCSPVLPSAPQCSPCSPVLPSDPQCSPVIPSDPQ